MDMFNIVVGVLAGNLLTVSFLYGIAKACKIHHDELPPASVFYAIAGPALFLILGAISLM